MLLGFIAVGAVRSVHAEIERRKGRRMLVRAAACGGGGGVMKVRGIAARAPEIVGSPWSFLVALGATLAWIALGALESFSGGWVLWPATATSVGAFLLVLLLQYSQNRDTRALQLKLDELIRSSEQARADLLRLEDMPDEHLADLEAEFTDLRAQERPEH
jgi:low affinity Fe/Cu permease